MYGLFLAVDKLEEITHTEHSDICNHTLHFKTNWMWGSGRGLRS